MVSVTSIVRRHFQQQREATHVARYGQPVLPKILTTAEPHEKWDDRKRMAILLIERGACALDCVEHMKAKGLWPRQEDFAQLRREGYAFKRELARFHELTPGGRRVAESVSKHVAAQLKLHHVFQASDSSAVSAKCTCGFFAIFQRKHFGEDAKLQRAINAHYADPMAWQRRHERTAVALKKADEEIDRAFGT